MKRTACKWGGVVIGILLATQCSFGAGLIVGTRAWVNTNESYTYFLNNNFNTNGNLMCSYLGNATSGGPREYDSTTGNLVNCASNGQTKFSLRFEGYIFHSGPMTDGGCYVKRINPDWDTNSIVTFMAKDAAGSNVGPASICSDGTNFYTDNYYAEVRTNMHYVHAYSVSNSPVSFSLTRLWSAPLGTNGYIRSFGCYGGYIYASPGGKAGYSRRIYAVKTADGTVTDTGVDVPGEAVIYSMVRKDNLLFASTATNLYVWDMTSDTNIDAGSVDAYSKAALNGCSEIIGVAYDGNKMYVGAGGGGSNRFQAFWAMPPPALASINPASKELGGADFTLTLNGTGFVTNSTVLWNGTERTTTYGSATQLTASILAADIATLGSASVTVSNPLPCIGVSAPQTLTITPQSQTITGFTPADGSSFLANETVGLAATADSGLPVSFSVISGGTITDGTNLSFTAAGIVRVVASQAGNAIYAAAPNVTNSFTISDIVSSFCADLDGDGTSDLVTVVGSNWYVWFSSASYQVCSGPFALGVYGTSLSGDIDGDGTDDLITVVGSKWYVRFSSGQYQVQSGPFDLGIAGIPAIGYIDDDSLADLVVVVDSNWYVWFSTAQYQMQFGPYDLGVAGLPAMGDIDGDGRDDLIVVDGSNWYVWFSTAEYQICSGPFDLGVVGTPATGYLDGDELADLIVVDGSNWYVWFSTAEYQVRSGPFALNTP